MSETKSEFDKIRLAHLYSSAEARSHSAAEFALFGLRSVLIANAGALAALLTFIGTKGHVDNAGWMVAVFSLGVALGLLSAWAGFITQSVFNYAELASAEKIYLGHTAASSEVTKQAVLEAKFINVGAVWRWGGVALYLASVIAFIAGAALAAYAIDLKP